MNARPEVTDAVELWTKWRPGSLRVTAFCTEPPDPNSVRWWESVTNQAPEIRNISRAGFGQVVEQGTIGDHSLHLQVQLGRVDWVLVSKDDPESESFPLLGEFDEAATHFRNLILRWLSAAPALNRLAFGAQLYIPVATQKEAMETIARMLPFVKINWEGIKDFVFQANRPRACVTVPNLGEINRLTKWQAVVRKKVVAIILPEGQTPVATKEEISAFLELDVNTPPPGDARTALLPELLPALLSELIQNAASMLKGGTL